MFSRKDSARFQIDKRDTDKKWGRGDLPFGKLFRQHNPAEDNNVHSVYFYLLWRLWVWQVGFTELSWWFHTLDCFCCGLGMWKRNVHPACFFYFLISHFSLLSHFLLYLTTSPSSFAFLSIRAKDMKNRLAFLRRRNESPGSNSAGKLDKTMKSVK